MIIFSTSDGAQLAYQPPRRVTVASEVPLNGVLSIDNTNPAVHIQWRMSRAALIRMALRCLWAATRRG